MGEGHAFSMGNKLISMCRLFMNFCIKNILKYSLFKETLSLNRLIHECVISNFFLFLFFFLWRGYFKNLPIILGIVLFFYLQCVTHVWVINIQNFNKIWTKSINPMLKKFRSFITPIRIFSLFFINLSFGYI